MGRIRSLFVISVLAVVSVPAFCQDVAVRASLLVDPSFDAPMENPVIVIRDGKVERVGANVAVPSGMRVIDLSSYTVLPGLIDCHVHIAGRPGDGGDTHKLQESVAYEAIYSVAHAKDHARIGFH